MTDSSTNNTIVLDGAAQGAQASPKQDIHTALPPGTRMGELEITGLVGEGGFGIVYLAQDHSLLRQVALKEYMPASLATRSADSSVSVRNERLQETFDLGKRSFVNEARLLAQFDHPSLVKVYRFWEANGTAYMVMPFYDGITLRDLLQKNAEVLDENWLKQLLDPITEALATIHAQNCYHRDIAPDNIMLLGQDHHPVLLDFGAARRVIGDMTQALTVILKPGYAPIEQYAEMPGMKQGAWTDIYALAAVVYYTILRRLPPPSVSRIMQDTYEPLSGLLKGKYSDDFLKGIDRCLAVRPEQRPQTIEEMRALLGIQATATESQELTGKSANTTTESSISLSLPEDEEEIIADIVLRPKKKIWWLITTLGIVICAWLISAAWFFPFSKKDHSVATSKSTQRTALPTANSVPSATSSISSTKDISIFLEDKFSDRSVASEPISNIKTVRPKTTKIHLQKMDSEVTSSASSLKSQKSVIPKHHSNRTSPIPSREATDNSEKDYLRKVNKDLDEMLQ